jgi:HlyD family type I secretion membrane fusion protein
LINIGRTMQPNKKQTDEQIEINVADMKLEDDAKKTNTESTDIVAVTENTVTDSKFDKLRDISDQCTSWIDQFTLFIKGSDEVLYRDASSASKAPIYFGMAVCAVFFGIFGLWAATAPLDSAAIAPGTVVLASNKKTVQHLEGGIIDKILVKEGDVVTKGQELIRLNSTTADAREVLLTNQIIAAETRESRLKAERNGANEIIFTDSITKYNNNPELAEIIDGENRLFYSHKQMIEGQTDILNQRIYQKGEEINGLQELVISMVQRLQFITEEKNNVAKLVKKQQATKPRLLALQRKHAELKGIKGQYQANIAQAKQAITESEQEKLNLKTNMLNKVEEQLRETQNQLSDLYERRRAATDILDRTVIAAPQSGVIANMQYHTADSSGVIPPGSPILDIVPQDDTLLIEARVSPIDIDVVRKGLKSRVRLTAFKSRSVPTLIGEVIHVSADKLIDPNTGIPYYKAKIEIDEQMLASLAEHIELYPGMPADVLIVTGERTFIEYLLSPISDSINKAFKEQ